MSIKLVLQESKKGVRQATSLQYRSGDINRVSVCYVGVRGFINRSGKILCRQIEADLIMSKKQEVEEFMTDLFGSDFKGLSVASTNDLDNPAKGDKRSSYFKH